MPSLHSALSTGLTGLAKSRAPPLPQITRQVFRGSDSGPSGSSDPQSLPSDSFPRWVSRVERNRVGLPHCVASATPRPRAVCACPQGLGGRSSSTPHPLLSPLGGPRRSSASRRGASWSGPGPAHRRSTPSCGAAGSGSPSNATASRRCTPGCRPWPGRLPSTWTSWARAPPPSRDRQPEPWACPAPPELPAAPR